MTSLPRIVSPEVSDLRRRVAALEAQIAAMIAAMEPSTLRKDGETMADIIRAVAARHGVSVDAMRGDDTSRRVATARHEAMAMARAGGRSLEQIGRAFHRHHTSVMHGIRQHESRQSGG